MSTPSPHQLNEIAATKEIRAQFPALEREHNGHPVAYFDAPGGTQTPRVVVDAVADYLLNHNANTHWEYPTSHETDAIIESARQTFGDFLNASANEIVFGANTTSTIYHLSRALGRTLGPGDEIVITELEHHANVAPWQALVTERGLTLHVAQMDPETRQLDWNDFERLVTKQTRMVAFGAGCNALGTLNHEGIAGAAAAVDFYASLVAQVDNLPNRRDVLQSSFAGLRAHSSPQVRNLWDSLARIDGVRLYGPPPDVERTPTVSFIIKSVASTEAARRLAERGLFVSHGDFYAQTVIERLGLAPAGLVRVGCAWYTSDDEGERLIDAVREIVHL